MNYKSFFKAAIIIILFISLPGLGMATDPVNPKTTPEARALLDLRYRNSGKYTLTGQHNYPNTKDQNSRFADFNQAYYDSLSVLSKGKPIALGEVGNPPTMDIFNTQPKWAYWVVWAGMVRNLSIKQYQILVNNSRMLSLEDAGYWETMAPFRKVCGLPSLPLKSKFPVSFSGKWVFNEEKSELGNAGSGNVPYEMEIDQDDDIVHIKKFMIVEYGPDRVTDDDIFLDGTEMKSTIFNFPRMSKAGWDERSKSIKMNSTMKFNRWGSTTEFKSREEWNMQENGNSLKIVQVSTGFSGSENIVNLVYDKK
jgi:hypothetical protein